MSGKKIGRTKNVVLNTFWITVCQLITTLLGIYSRKVFLSVLGAELLGVNSLFSDVLLLFSFADMGVGVAITFALYKPIAEENTEKIQSLLNFYKKIYRYVIGFLLAVSFAFVPFLRYLKTDIPMEELIVYYAIFQFNNIVGYMFAYRETYIIARQRERDLAIFNLIIGVLRAVLQIVSLKLFENFLLYLLISSFFVVVNKIAVNIYIQMKYPETKLKQVQPLAKEEEKLIFRKSAAMLVHRVGNLAINQTDSLIVSYMISVVQWGLVSNYLTIKTAVTTVMARIYSSVLPSMGDLIAKEDREKQLRVFHIYDLFNFWIYAFCFVALFVLSTPFVSLYFGDAHTVDSGTIFLLCMAFFVDGLRSPVSAVREAGGAYEKDKWFTIVAALVNLVSSVMFVWIMDLPGIYLGTIMAMAVLIISRTAILFRDQFGISPWKYLLDMLVKVLLACAGCAITACLCWLVQHALGLSVGSFVIMMAIVVAAPNVFWFAVFAKNPFFKEMISIVKRIGKRN